MAGSTDPLLPLYPLRTAVRAINVARKEASKHAFSLALNISMLVPGTLLEFEEWIGISPKDASPTAIYDLLLSKNNTEHCILGELAGFQQHRSARREFCHLIAEGGRQYALERLSEAGVQLEGISIQKIRNETEAGLLSRAVKIAWESARTCAIVNPKSVVGAAHGTISTYTDDQMTTTFYKYNWLQVAWIRLGNDIKEGIELWKAQSSLSPQGSGVASPAISSQIPTQAASSSQPSSLWALAQALSRVHSVRAYPSYGAALEPQSEEVVQLKLHPVQAAIRSTPGLNSGDVHEPAAAAAGKKRALVNIGGFQQHELSARSVRQEVSHAAAQGVLIRDDLIKVEAAVGTSSGPADDMPEPPPRSINPQQFDPVTITCVINQPGQLRTPDSMPDVAAAAAAADHTTQPPVLMTSHHHLVAQQETSSLLAPNMSAAGGQQDSPLLVVWCHLALVDPAQRLLKLLAHDVMKHDLSAQSARQRAEQSAATAKDAKQKLDHAVKTCQECTKAAMAALRQACATMSVHLIKEAAVTASPAWHDVITQGDAAKAAVDTDAIVQQEATVAQKALNELSARYQHIANWSKQLVEQLGYLDAQQQLATSVAKLSAWSYISLESLPLGQIWTAAESAVAEGLPAVDSIADALKEMHTHLMMNDMVHTADSLQSLELIKEMQSCLLLHVKDPKVMQVKD